VLAALPTLLLMLTHPKLVSFDTTILLERIYEYLFCMPFCSAQGLNGNKI
jgi:hypothetical protein